MKYFYNGVEIVTSYMVKIEKAQKRKHRKKRINKKWLKKYGLVAKSYDSFIFDGKIIMHPLVFEKLKNNKNVTSY